MSSSQSNQTRPRFATLFNDASQDPVKGDNAKINELFNANGQSAAEPSTIKATLSSAALQGPGLTSIIAMVNGKFGLFYTPFAYVPRMGAPDSPYRDKTLAIGGELMGVRSFVLYELPTGIYHKTAEVLTLKAEHMSDHFVANPTATSVGPFSTADETKDEMEKIKSRKSAYLPHNLGLLMNPEGAGELTVAHFWTKVYPVIVAEGAQAVHQHLIQYFQVAATLGSAGGASLVHHNSLGIVGWDEGVFETVEECILDRLFPHSNSSASLDGSGFREVAREIGALAASSQRQAEEAEERRKQKEKEKYSFSKKLGEAAVKRIKAYNALSDSITDERLAARIPFFEKLYDVDSTKESDNLKALQEALDEVLEELEVDVADTVKVTPQLLKAILDPWERHDTDAVGTGVGSNFFLHGPKCATTAEEQIQVFHATLAATNAPDPEVLKKLYSGDLYVPTIADVGYTLRNAMYLMMTVTVPRHPYIVSLKKVINKWTSVERTFTQHAMGDNEPQRGIYLLEAMNMKMNEYWIEQRKSDCLIEGPDLLQLFQDIRAKRPWKPDLSPTYRRLLKLDQFVGVYGAHRILLDGGSKAQVVVAPVGNPYNTPKESHLKQGDDDKRQGDTSAVTNEQYTKQGINLFGRFKKRKDPGTGKEYSAKRVRDEASTPLPASKSGSGLMCLAYHCKGLCNAKCPRAADHIYYTDEEYQPLIAWCEKCYPGTDM
jgi:hypothetical protein